MTETTLSIIIGDTIPLTITVKDNGAVKNITGYTFYFTAKNRVEDEQNVIYKKVTSLTDPTHGITDLVLSENDTDVPSKKYVYKIYCVSPTGVKTTLFYGDLITIKA